MVVVSCSIVKNATPSHSSLRRPALAELTDVLGMRAVTYLGTRDHPKAVSQIYLGFSSKGSNKTAQTSWEPFESLPGMSSPLPPISPRPIYSASSAASGASGSTRRVRSLVHLWLGLSQSLVGVRAWPILRAKGIDRLPPLENMAQMSRPCWKCFWTQKTAQDSTWGIGFRGIQERRTVRS